MITVLIVDDLVDHQTYLYTALSSDPDIRCVGISGNGSDALRKARELKPDIILMDIGLPDMNGITCMLKIAGESSPGSRFVIYTVHEEDEFVFEALKAGAHSYIVKRSKPYQIVDAVKDVYRGERPISSSIATKILAQVPLLKPQKADMPQDNLTTKEKEILKYLSRGLTYQEVADQAGITIKTLKWHVHNIYNKLQADNRTEAINKYYGYQV